jgi:methylmalonyl-CoA mutase cobalamin-binding subunit
VFRVLLAPTSAVDDDPPAGAVARRLRDDGHEVVLLGVSADPSAWAATAVQEDVDLVVLVGDAPSGAAEQVTALLAEADAGDVVVLFLGPEGEVADLLQNVRRALGVASSGA